MRRQPGARHGSAPVVVRVTAASDDAVDWAAAEASIRGLPLRLVSPEGATAGELGAAASRARAVDRDLAVESCRFSGSALPALLRESRTAALLVLGAPAATGLTRLGSGRAPLRLASSGACPVTVVRALPRATDQRSRPRVVVGIDGAPSSGPALGFAVRAARGRGLPLTVVHAWSPDTPADLEGVCAPRAVTEAGAARLVDRTLASWRQELLDVPVTAELRCGDAASALVAASGGAALVVLGIPGRRRPTGAVRSVGRRVLAGVAGPVVVIGPEGCDAEPGRRGLRSASSR
ncbi:MULTISPECIES: universal stress protein [unclassified Blastococcus]|uniref:universal stress protein n=1 Tax=unclassified Blastococcus TaxID=2619396 RepID=UPI001EEFE56C|nr:MULTISPECIES: universal stress protein [unclassified Blastococcus]